MNILLINHYAGSPRYGMEYRPYYLAKEWVRLGHKVSIVCADFSHLRRENPSIPKSLTRETIDNIEYMWMKTPHYHGNGISRVINMFSFVAQLFTFGKWISDFVKPDLVIASSTYPLDIYPAKRIAAMTGAKLIFEVHDLWPLTPIELGGMSPRHPFIMLLQHAENWAYKKADKVVSLLPKAQEHMVEHGMSHDKFAYVPNGIDTNEWAGDGGEIRLHVLDRISELKKNGNFIVGYTGTHGLSDAMDSLLYAAEMLAGKKISFVLVGDGTGKENLIQLKQKLKLDSVHFFDPVPKNAIPSLLKAMDAVFIGSQKVAMYRFGVSPNKLMDYMMAGKPVIQAIEAGNDLVKENGCGISISPGDVHALANAIVTLKTETPDVLKIMGAKGRDYISQHHTYHRLAQKFLDVLK